MCIRQMFFVFILVSECIDDADAVLEASNGLTSDCVLVIGMAGCDGDALDGSGRKVKDVCCASCNRRECFFFFFSREGSTYSKKKQN